MVSVPDTKRSPALVDGVAWVAMGDEAVLVGADDRVHLVPPPGSLILPFLDGSTTVSELAEDVAEVFGIDLASATADLTEFVESLCERGVVVT